MTATYDGVPCIELAARLRTPGLLCLDEVGSTLDVVHELAGEGAPAGTVVVADAQTRGRGRQGRPWHSPAGTGVWLGYLVRARGEPPTGVLALRVGMTVADALRTLGPTVRLKWPNDVLLDDRKLAGVLCEARETRGDRWVAVGIGMNVHGPLPAALGRSAVALEEWLPHVRRVDVLEALLPPLQRIALDPELSPAECERFADLDWLRGRVVDEPLQGTACGVAPDGALLVRTVSGTSRVTGGSVRAA